MQFPKIDEREHSSSSKQRISSGQDGRYSDPYNHHHDLVVTLYDCRKVGSHLFSTLKHQLYYRSIKNIDL